MKRDLQKITDLSAAEILGIISNAFEFKKGLHEDLQRKVVAMVFEKPSLRTKIAFEVAAQKLNCITSYVNNEPGRESAFDMAKNLERFSDLILARVYSHETIRELSAASSKPVINALCDRHHPTQALADLMTIIWHKKSPKDLRVAFIGDGNNVATSLMQVCAMTGINFAIASPEGYEISKEDIPKSSSKIELLRDPNDAVKNADVIYTDTFISMGEENERADKIRHFAHYQVNMPLLKKAKPDAIFMHCLPAHRGEEVTDEVMDSEQSKVFDQAECRMHIAKALLSKFLK